MIGNDVGAVLTEQAFRKRDGEEYGPRTIISFTMQLNEFERVLHTDRFFPFFPSADRIPAPRRPMWPQDQVEIVPHFDKALIEQARVRLRLRGCKEICLFHDSTMELLGT